MTKCLRFVLHTLCSDLLWTNISPLVLKRNTENALCNFTSLVSLFTRWQSAFVLNPMALSFSSTSIHCSLRACSWSASYCFVRLSVFFSVAEATHVRSCGLFICWQIVLVSAVNISPVCVYLLQAQMKSGQGDVLCFFWEECMW